MYKSQAFPLLPALRHTRAQGMSGTQETGVGNVTTFVQRALRIVSPVLLLVAFFSVSNKAFHGDACLSRRVYARRTLSEVFGNPYIVSSGQLSIAHTSKSKGMRLRTRRSDLHAYPVDIEDPAKTAAFIHNFLPSLSTYPLSVQDVEAILHALDTGKGLDSTRYLEVTIPLSHVGFVPEKAASFFHHSPGWVAQKAPTLFRMLTLTHAEAWAGSMFPNLYRCAGHSDYKTIKDIEGYWVGVESVARSSRRTQACIHSGQPSTVDISGDPLADITAFSSVHLLFIAFVLLGLASSFAVYNFPLPQMESLPEWLHNVPSGFAMLWNVALIITIVVYAVEERIPVNNAVVSILIFGFATATQSYMLMPAVSGMGLAAKNVAGQVRRRLMPKRGMDAEVNEAKYGTKLSVHASGWRTNDFMLNVVHTEALPGPVSSDDIKGTKSMEDTRPYESLLCTEFVFTSPLLLVLVLVARSPNVNLDGVQLVFVTSTVGHMMLQTMKAYTLTRGHHESKVLSKDNDYPVAPLLQLLAAVMLVGASLGSFIGYLEDGSAHFMLSDKTSLLPASVLVVVSQSVFLAIFCVQGLVNAYSRGSMDSIYDMSSLVYHMLDLAVKLYIGFTFGFLIDDTHIPVHSCQTLIAPHPF